MYKAWHYRKKCACKYIQYVCNLTTLHSLMYRFLVNKGRGCIHVTNVTNVTNWGGVGVGTGAGLCVCMYVVAGCDVLCTGIPRD